MRLALLLLLFGTTLQAQTPSSAPGRIITCESHDTLQAYLPPRASIVDGSAELTATFDLVYTSSVPAEARNSMQFAADIWGSYLISDVPIRVSVDWTDEEDDQLLASAGPATVYRNFFGAPEPNVWYPVALAEALRGDTLNNRDAFDIVVVVNSTTNWNYSTDGSVPRNRIDLATVFLHELGHGLGILSSVDSVGPDSVRLGLDNFFFTYDLFLETPPGRSLVDAAEFDNPSSELLQAIIDRLEFVGDSAKAKNGDENVPLFAPEAFDVGSSVSHLDEEFYPSGTPNSLMTPSLASGEAIHDPGQVTLGLLYDIGWPLSFISTPVREVFAGTLGVFPNPATESFTVTLSDVISPTEAILFDPSGREVSRQNIAGQGTQAQVSVSGLPPGLYTLFVPDGDRAFRGRVVVR